MNWQQALQWALYLSHLIGRKYYIRGYQRTISHKGEWLYGVYDMPNPKISRKNRPNQWWDKMEWNEE
jgi:hypothetical protein